MPGSWLPWQRLAESAVLVVLWEWFRQPWALYCRSDLALITSWPALITNDSRLQHYPSKVIWIRQESTGSKTAFFLCRYNELLFIIDTCQGASMYERFYSPNLMALASSQVGEDSLSVSQTFCSWSSAHLTINISCSCWILLQFCRTFEKSLTWKS